MGVSFYYLFIHCYNNEHICVIILFDFYEAVLVSYPLDFQNFSLVGRPQTMDDGSTATMYQYNATLPNNALVSVSFS